MDRSIYTLNDGDNRMEVDRLQYQHSAVLTPMTGGLVPEKIQQHLTSLKRAPVIADIATGTGVWLLDLASRLPSDAQLDGYDFDTSKYPEPSQLPPNVRLMWADVLKPFPEEACGKYDLVHVRFLMYGLKAHQWEAVAVNLRSLLRPGGYLLWTETGYPTIMCLPMTESFQKLLNVSVRYGASVGRDISAPVRLLDQIKNVGYINCFQNTFSSYSKDKDIQKLAGKVILAGVRKSMHGIVTDGGFDWAQAIEDVEKVVNRLHDEIENDICSVGFEIYWVVGQKP